MVVRLWLFLLQERCNAVIKVDPAGPADMNGIFHKARLAAIVRIVNDIIEALRAQLVLDLVGCLIIHRHGKTSHLFPLGINRCDHKDDVGIGLFKLIQDDFQISILG